MSHNYNHDDDINATNEGDVVATSIPRSPPPLPPVTTTTTTTTSISIRVLFFAAARDAVNGQSQIDLTFDVNNNETTTPITANTVRDTLLRAYPKLRPFLQRDVAAAAITMALNEVYIPLGTDPVVHDNDVMAIIPPISGG